MSSTRPRRQRWADATFDRGQAAVEFALVLPLLAIFTVVLVQFAVVARDQMSLWQTARDAAREIALSNDPAAEVARWQDVDGFDVAIEGGVVTVSATRKQAIRIVGLDFVRPSIVLRARVSMALEPPLAFAIDGGDQALAAP